MNQRGLRTGIMLLMVGLIAGMGGTSRAAEDVAQAAELGPATELKIYERAVPLKVKIQCRKYEGRVLSCTLDPRRVAQKLPDSKAVLGYSRVELGDQRFRVMPDKGAAIRLYPEGEGTKEDISGERQLTIYVVYAN